MTPPPFGRGWSASRRLGSDPELRSWLDLALGCADQADAIAMQHFRRDLEIATKPDRTYVTQADRAIEELVRSRVRTAHPDHGVVGEEYGEDQPGASVRWYVDPIDGTHNFVRGIPVFATLLAVQRDGEVQAGLMSAPALGERWFAWRGGGAWAVRARELASPIRVSGVTRLDEAQLLHGSENLERSELEPRLRALLRRAWRVRGFGDFWSYALVAEGSAEAMVEDGIHPWDLAAPLVVVEEAGGRFTDLEGARRIDTGSAVATNGLLHDEVLRSLAGA
jgi:histidinol-phosphatase